MVVWWVIFVVRCAMYSGKTNGSKVVCRSPRQKALESDACPLNIAIVIFDIAMKVVQPVTSG